MADGNEWPDNPCFVCGNQNPYGMHVHFAYQAERHQVSAEVTLSDKWQGFQGIVHGGILAGLMDDAMWHVLWQETHLVTMTADLRVRYHKPVKIHIPVRITGTMVEADRRLIKASARVEQHDQVVAVSEGVFLRVKTLQ